MYGAVNWFDESAAACGEMVFDVIRALGVPLTPEIATHIYLAILTDTGSFHHSNITPRTFDICRQTVEAGVNPAAMARRVFDSNSFGKLKLIGALLDEMELVDDGRLAVLYMDDAMLDGLRLHAQRHRRAHQPAADRARDPGGRVLQGRRPTATCASACARSTTSTCGWSPTTFGGGGHKNAAGFTVAGPLDRGAGRGIIERLVARRSTKGLRDRAPTA